MALTPEGVYTTTNVDTRHKITWEALQNMPMLDEDHSEIPVYCNQGFIIPRRVPCFSKNTPAQGMLLNLTNVKELFDPSQDDSEGDYWEDDNLTNTYVYPQAGLKTAGHYQANSIMRSFKRFLAKVNVSLQNEDIGVHGNIEADRRAPIVSGVASQGYNAVMHSTRGHSAQHHDAQLGIITAALAGSWARTDTGKRVASKFQEKCARQLPHKAFEEKIKNPNIKRDLRLENVYYVDVKRMRGEDQNGRYVIDL